MASIQNMGNDGRDIRGHGNGQNVGKQKYLSIYISLISYAILAQNRPPKRKKLYICIHTSIHMHPTINMKKNSFQSLCNVCL